ncbi:MAG: archease [Pseudomonadota bacterium]
MSEVRSHRFEDHTGEVRLVLSAPTLKELFLAAAEGLAELVSEDDPGEPSPDEYETRVLHARDRELLLADFLNELIYLTETTERVFTDVHIDELSDHALVFRARGIPLRRVRTAVKAATLHGLSIEQRADGFGASVVLDV